MSIEQPSMDFHYDRIIDENFSGEIADKLKEEVRNSSVIKLIRNLQRFVTLNFNLQN